MYATYVIDFWRNQPPGPFEHCPPGVVELGDFYLLALEEAQQLRQFFGSNQSLPLIKKANYQAGSWICILNIVDIKSLTDPKPDGMHTQIFMWKHALPYYSRILTRNGKEVAHVIKGKYIRTVFRELRLKSYDSLYIIV